MSQNTVSHVALVAGMFGREFSPVSVMGLSCGQMRPTEHPCSQCGKKPWGREQCTCVPRIKDKCEKAGHNNSWYNQAGEKLGWGDVCTCDLTRVAQQMDPSHVFYLLGEYDSHWQLPEGTNPERPGLPYVQRKMRSFITNGNIYHICRDDSDYVGRVEGNNYHITRAHAHSILNTKKEV